MAFQTYGWNITIRQYLGERVYRLVQWLCGRITGHQWSPTEWGYGFGGVDVWCQWCDHFETISLEEAAKIFPSLRKTVYDITGKLPTLDEKGPANV
jgi:hypothetical protein